MTFTIRDGYYLIFVYSSVGLSPLMVRWSDGFQYFNTRFLNSCYQISTSILLQRVWWKRFHHFLCSRLLRNSAYLIILGSHGFFLHFYFTAYLFGVMDWTSSDSTRNIIYDVDGLLFIISWRITLFFDLRVVLLFFVVFDVIMNIFGLCVFD